MTANGFAGNSSGGTTPALTLSTTVTGILSGDGTAISAAATTGSGSVVLATSPTLVTPALGTPTALVGTNITGTAAGLTAGTVTTNANLTGDVTSVGNATTITPNIVTNAMLATVATQTFKGRTTASTGNVEDLSATQATAILNTMVGDSGAGGTKGLVPAPAAGDAAASKFLKADGTWVVPPGVGTVTSVGASGPSGIATWSSAVTTSGTLTQTLSNQNANLVLAGPTTGGAATPAFRALVANDVPGSIGGGLVLIASAVASTSSTIDFTSINNAAYDSYVIVLNNIIPVTAGNLLLRISNSGVFVAANYTWQTIEWTTVGSGVTGQGGTATGIVLNAGGVDAVSAVANHGGSWVVQIFNCAQGVDYHKIVHQGHYLGSTQLGIVGTGIIPTLAAIDGFRFLFDSGDISSGTFYLYGRKNA